MITYLVKNYLCPFIIKFLTLLDSIKIEASHIILELLRTKNIRWHSSYTVKCTLAHTRPWSTVARCKSNHRCKPNSLSFIVPPKDTSVGPHNENSKTDFTCVRDTARSLLSNDCISDVIFTFGRRCAKAIDAIEHNEPISSFLCVISSPNL